MFDDTALRAIQEAAARHGVDAAALLAVAHVESGLRTHALVGGRDEPLIRFEGHYFDRRLAGAKREEARRKELASPVAGAIRNPASQAARWRMLARARAIDARAADESVSWGIGQVMGAHWAWLGYASVDALVGEVRSGLAGQVGLMLRYIDRAGLTSALDAGDWTAFARGYNGPGFARNGYDRRLAEAHRLYGASAATPVPGLVLRRGDRGAAVRRLQDALSTRGHALTVDGDFGPKTAGALRAFQRSQGLAVDGIAGPATWAALAAETPIHGGIVARLMRWLGSLWVDSPQGR